MWLHLFRDRGRSNPKMIVMVTLIWLCYWLINTLFFKSLPQPSSFFGRIHLKCPYFTASYIFLLVIDPDFWFLLVVKSRDFLIIIYFLTCLITFDSKPNFSERCFCEGSLYMVGCGCLHLLWDPIVSVISGRFLSFSLFTYLPSFLSLFSFPSLVGALLQFG